MLKLTLNGLLNNLKTNKIMETETMILAILVVAIVFFYLGKYIERIEWNKLIQNGKIPKPFKNK
jgi:hypothetical protein